MISVRSCGQQDYETSGIPVLTQINSELWEWQPFAPLRTAGCFGSFTCDPISQTWGWVLGLNRDPCLRLIFALYCSKTASAFSTRDDTGEGRAERGQGGAQTLAPGTAQLLAMQLFSTGI